MSDLFGSSPVPMFSCPWLVAHFSCLPLCLHTRTQSKMNFVQNLNETEDCSWQSATCRHVELTMQNVLFCLTICLGTFLNSQVLLEAPEGCVHVDAEGFFFVFLPAGTEKMDHSRNNSCTCGMYIVLCVISDFTVFICPYLMFFVCCCCCFFVLFFIFSLFLFDLFSASWCISPCIPSP